MCVLLDVNRLHLSNTSLGDGLCEGGEFPVRDIEVIFWLTDKNLIALGCACATTRLENNNLTAL